MVNSSALRFQPWHFRCCCNATLSTCRLLEVGGLKEVGLHACFVKVGQISESVSISCCYGNILKNVGWSYWGKKVTAKTHTFSDSKKIHHFHLCCDFQFPVRFKSCWMETLTSSPQSWGNSRHCRPLVVKPTMHSDSSRRGVFSSASSCTHLMFGSTDPHLKSLLYFLCFLFK